MTVQDVYDRVTKRLLENGGFQLGLVTDAQFLLYFADVLLDFCEKTGISKEIVTQSIFAGQAAYIIPDEQMTVDVAMLDGRILERTNVSKLASGLFEWRNLIDTPRLWHQDGLPVKQIELVPAPVMNGVLYPGGGPPFAQTGDFFVGDGNLTTVGSQKPAQTSFAPGDPIPLLPDDAVMYLGWGVLEKIFSDDGEMKDAQRAQYCAARFDEGVFLFRSAMVEELEDDPDDLAS